MTTDGLALRDIGVRFGGLVALEGVSLDVPPGTVVGVIGPNGAGKTTLFNVICGFVRPHTGTLTLDGAVLRPRPHELVRLGIGRTLQGLGIFAGLTVLENVMVGANVTARAGFAAALLGLPASDRDERALRERAMARLDELGIAAHAQQPAGALPFGLRKRVAFARALAGEPRLLLLDEPASGLGTDDVDELAELIRGLPGRSWPERRLPPAVMLVEHHMDLVMRVCDQIVVLDFGRVIAAGTPDDVRDDPAVNDAYLGTEVDA
jgi:branched-chain amino acid transport system ATP-binding protein